ncbi:nucleotidyltransferase family protein [Heliobacterium chlorum]|uniref:Nucleotidyltransferase family protein n=1 Tax=Heliobacterium chlorum TaxID=2698 RepID=A0ABR7T0V4_HELCL|nr:nucleotidyltransferase family protein [Heliobacterium chlorum]MBC9784430.1 nucleotidyltransferase family protein [Heliobacterium chlorum]
MGEWKKVLVKPFNTILETIKIIDSGAVQIALVINEQGVLQGTVTDGDIRRGILKGVTLDKPIELVMNRTPFILKKSLSRQSMIELTKNVHVHQIPIVDEHGRVVDLLLVQDILKQEKKRDNWVVLMAGGLGARLRPLTETVPKPLLKVGNKPLLETIIENFIQYGFRKFYLSVNYKAHMIQEYFGDGSQWGAEIRYLHEKERLGTAGALSLLPELPKKPLIVMNGDLLTKVNFEQLMDFHADNDSQGTMCVREYDFQVPYGVVKIQGHTLTGIDEKPVQRFFVNAGIYVLNPEVIKLIPKDTQFDMPSLFEKMIEENQATSAFPIREYWIDIGHLIDYEKANGEFMEVFG